jgi:medium-chain acyl-[acyl-carrier-protein] hydrolase
MPSEYFIKPYTISFYDTDFKGDLSIISLLKILNEAARDHAEVMGFGYNDLNPLNLVWVLSRIHLKIHHNPRIFDKVDIKTRSLGSNHIFAFREFMIVSNNEVIIEAISAWIVIDPSTRKFSKITQALKGFTVIDASQYLEKLKIDEKISTDLSTLNYSPVLPSELDFNGHMNASRYIERIYNSFDTKFHQKHLPAEVTIIYNKEATEGDKLAVAQHFINDIQCVCYLVNKANMDEMCRIKLLFQ